MIRHHSHLIYIVCALVIIVLPLTAHAVPARQDVTPQPDIIAAPTDVPAETPTETPAETPAETPTDVPAETLAETPTEISAETPTPTPEMPLPPMLMINQVCTPDGIVFTIVNQGGPMVEPSSFMLVLDGQSVTPPAPVAPVVQPTQSAGEGATEWTPDVPSTDANVDPAQMEDATGEEAQDEAVSSESGDPSADVAVISIAVTPAPVPAQIWPHTFTLAPGESLTLAGGFGRPTLYVDSMVSQPVEPCVNPPVLSASAVCTFEEGVLFTITNSGGPMLSAAAVTIEPNTAITPDAQPIQYDLLLAAGESVTLVGGYGQPTLTAADLNAGVDEPCWSPAEVYGLVWEDTNNDGVYSEGDTGLANVSVILLDDAGMTIASVTDDTGRYAFPMLRTGSYTFSVDMTTLSADHVALAESAVRLDVLQGLTHEVNFGFRVDASAQISGSVWLELANWGVRDPEDLPIATAQVELVDSAGAVVMVAPVNPETGAYTFSGLRAGDYIVRLVEGSLFAPYGITYDADGDFNLETPITLTHGLIVDGIDFGVVGTY